MVAEDGNKSDGSQEDSYGDPSATYQSYYRPWYHQPYPNKSQLNEMLNVDHLTNVTMVEASSFSPQKEQNTKSAADSLSALIIKTKQLHSNNKTILEENEDNEKQIEDNLNNNYIENDNNNHLNNNYNNNNNYSNKTNNNSSNDLMSDKISDKNNLKNINNEEKIYTYLGLKFRAPFKWVNLLLISAYHLYFVYAFFYFAIFSKHHFLTTIWGFVMGGICGFGVTGGVHRMWSHRSYKAKTPLRIILMMCFSAAGQNSIYDWVRDHRIHHKYSETDADPHNSNRGFFFAHVGWLMMKKHPRVIEKGNQIDMSDILNDPVVQFHEKYFVQLKLLLCFIIPVMIPMFCWNETFYTAFISQVFIRYIFSLNFTWLVNSAAHLYGNRPYDKRINPVENWSVAIAAMGEGWHNYHHVFPWDYKAAELGNYRMNFTTAIIDFFSKIGWAYDLKQPTKELIQRTIIKHGDGSHPGEHHHHHEEVPDPELDENCNITNKTK